MLAEADERAAAFAERYAGNVAELDGPGLAEAMAELAGDRRARRPRAGNYAHLRFAVDTIDPANGALVARVSEKATAVETKLLFFDLEWAAVDDERADELLGADGLDTSRHHLRTVRRYRPYLLSEPEEKIMTEKAVSGREAWSRLFEEQTSAIKVDTPGDEEPVKLDVALSRLLSPDRELRRTTAEAVTAALAPEPPHARLHLQHDRPGQGDRRPPPRLPELDLEPQPRQRGQRRVGPGARRGGALELRPAAALVPAEGEPAGARPARRLRPLRLDRDRGGQDRMARGDARSCSSSFNDFSPTLHDTAKRFFDEHWIDAPVRPGKRGGAFCAYTVPSVHPYVMLNWTDAPARRPHPRPRARPRHARRARPAARDPRAAHAAHARRDRVGVRRDARLPPPARRRRDAGLAAQRCWPRTSRARSRPSSARSR